MTLTWVGGVVFWRFLALSRCTCLPFLVLCPGNWTAESPCLSGLSPLSSQSRVSDGFLLQVQWLGNYPQGWKLEQSEATPHLCCLSDYWPAVPCLENHYFLDFIYFCGVVSDRTLNLVSTIVSWPKVEVTQIKIFKWFKIHLPQRGVIHNIVLLIVWTTFLFRIDNIN